MPTPRFKERIVDWSALHDSLIPLLPEMPHLTRDHAALAAVLTEARNLESRQDFATGELRTITQRRRELGVEGRNLRNRLVSGLRSAFGETSETLLKYRVQPQARQIQRRVQSKAEKAEQLAKLAARLAAQAEAEAAVQAAVEAKARLTRPQGDVEPKA